MKRILYFSIVLVSEVWNVPGMAVGIIKNDQILLAKGYGVLETGGDEKVNSQTLFAIASNTKAFTTSAIASLVDKEKLHWDDRVRKYIPDFTLYDSYISDNITVRDLLCHRAGYADFSGDLIWYKSDRTASELLKNYRHVPKEFNFRDGYGYTNLMFMAAGEIIHKITGQPWSTYVEKYFFTPLNMDRTVTSTDKLTGLQNVATPHKPVRSIISCVDDMLKWLNLHLHKGNIENEYFSRASQLEMWHPHNNYRVTDKTKEKFPSRNFAAYGLGWSLYDHMGEKVVTHGGAYDGMYSRVVMVPGEELGIVILTNSMKFNSAYLSYTILDHFLNGDINNWDSIGLESYDKYASSMQHKKDEIKEKRQLNTKPSLSQEDIIGSYYDQLYGAHIHVKNDENGELKLSFDTASDLSATLTHWHYDTYFIEWNKTHAWFDFGTLHFVKDNNNEVKGMEFDVPNGDIYFHELHPKKIK